MFYDKISLVLLLKKQTERRAKMEEIKDMLNKIHLWINSPIRYMICITLGFVTGIILYMADITVFLYIYVFLSILLFIILGIFIVKKIKGERLSGYLRLSLLFSIFILFGMLRIGSFDYSYTERLKKLSSEDAIYTGIALSDATSVDEKLKTVSVFVSHCEINNEKKELGENIALYYEKDGFYEILPGDYVEFYGKPLSSDNGFSINQKSEKILAFVYSPACIRIENNNGRVEKITFGQRLKVSIKKAVKNIFGYNPAYKAIVTGILTGDTAEFSDYLYGGFKSGGFAHTVAVSGLHVSLLYLLLAYILEKMKINKTIISVAGIIVVFAFCGVAGYTASALRAAIMIGVRISSFYLKREYDILSSLFFSAFIIVAYNPYMIFTAGFLLSFGATFGIAIYSGLFKNIIASIKLLNYVPSFVTESVNLSVSAFLGTMPICLYFFNSVNFTSIISNIWIIASVTVIFALSGVACIFYYIFPWISLSVIRYLTEPFLIIVNKTAQFFQNHNAGTLEFGFVPAGAYGYSVAFSVGIFILLKYINIRLEK